MTREIDIPHENMSGLEEKIYVMADEVLDILKQLARDNKQQLNSKLIAERMFIRDTVKKMLEEPEQNKSDSKTNSNLIKDIADTVLNRFSELTPFSVTGQLGSLKDQLNDETILKDTTKWLDSTVKIIKKYYESLSKRNEELEEFMHQTMDHLEETELHLTSELSSHQHKFTEDREFEKALSTNMNMIKQDFHTGKDINSIKKAVLGKIENINKGIEIKREQDMKRLRETERTLQAMGARIHDIKKEADEIKKKAEEIESESLRDNLTGLYNRKAYDQKITETLAGLVRYDVPSSLLVCDVDNFKNINDAFGHKVGDLALRKLASLLKVKLRVNDFISRYGGEEFAIILPHTDLTGAVKAGEAIIAYINKSVFSYKDNKIPLTISIGVSILKKTDDAGAVFERADSALYLAKQFGKNNVKTEDDLTKENSPLNQSGVQR
ncbi:MAG: GGDEF domain-containing protein [Nitrospirae bacterium]|nr:GGDEF domain-containing protein [Nitrospirota bacterium]